VETVNESQLDVVGIQRLMQTTSGDPVECHSYYSPEGLYIYVTVKLCEIGYFVKIITQSLLALAVLCTSRIPRISGFPK